jgi:RF-1 domain
LFHPATLEDETLLAETSVKRQRRSGPGGQHRNKVETAIFLTHEPTGVSASASERRSQEENRKVAIRRLRISLAIEVRTEQQAAEAPSELWKQRCAEGRIVINPDHRDFAKLLAEGLDVLAAVGWDVSQAAATLQTTATQLIKLAKLEPRAFELLNTRRAELGLHKLL